MDRQQIRLQEQANQWLEQQKKGFTAVQEQQFQKWLTANPEHLTCFEQSKQIDGLLNQLSAHQIDALSNSNSVSFTHSRIWIATAACFALCMLSLISYTLWPQSNDYSAQYNSQIGEQFDVTLPDGSQLSLDAKTKLSINFDDDRRLNTLVKGRALFDVSKDAKRPFIISTGTTKITVLGTKFTVDKKTSSTHVSVEHGRVKVQTNTHAVELIQGQQAQINKDGITVENIDLNRVDAWRHGRLIFNNTPLDEVLAEFNRYHAINVKITDDKASQLLVSGTFLAHEFEKFLALLPHVLPVKIKSSLDQVVIEKV